MRNTFNEQLEQLNVELIKMGALCEEAISAATKAYLEEDGSLGERACQLEQEIDHKERDIEGQCMKLLLRQQPVASDLRAVSAALRMISDMERIGDQAADIAEISRDIESNQLARQVPMEEMAREAISMVTDSVDSFVRGDLALAHSVIAQDDKLDHLFLQVREELISLIAAGKAGSVCLDMMMIAKYFERIGDHACNIAQWVEYAITGTYEDD
ncbi:MAG: phosphate signaling complex protein PhoU [Lawsonibacter sp.]|jgi:phosphate transport system protein